MRSQRLYEIRREIIEALEKFAKEVNATIYLFGSYARGDHTLESDVDVIIVCNRFEGMKYVDRIEFIRMKLPRDVGFDIVTLTPKELSDKMKRAFFREVSKYWIEIKP